MSNVIVSNNNNPEILYPSDKIDQADRPKIIRSMISFACRVCLFVAYHIIWLLKSYDDHVKAIYHVIRSKWTKIDSSLTEKLAKTPKHLALCISIEDSGQIDLDKIIKIINWCQTLSIETLTIYHYSEKLSQIDSDRIMSMFSKIKVKFISFKSSHQSLIETARQICEKDSSITMKQISDNLIDGNYYTLPDPELLICFSRQKILQAFPPWQLRLTEIVFLPSHRSINESLFLDELRRFTRCNQRFGR